MMFDGQSNNTGKRVSSLPQSMLVSDQNNDRSNNNNTVVLSNADKSFNDKTFADGSNQQ